MNIEIRSLKKLPLDRREVKSNLGQILKCLNEDDASLSIFFVDDEKISELNLKYRGIAHPTDVLAFSMREGEDGQISSGLLGDVVISLETAQRCAKKFRHSLEKEIYLYLIHGILHLLGFGDKTKSQKDLIKKKQKELLSLICHKET